MIDSDYIKIFTGSFIVVQLINDNLNAVGVSAVIKDETESGRLAGFGSSIPGLQEMYVHKDEIDKAVEIVESVTSELDT
jgi:hypothetical protein